MTDKTQDKTQDPAAPAAVRGAAGKKAAPDALTLATDWARQNEGVFVFIEGAQWWRYEGGCWSYSSVERVEASVQAFLTARHSVNPRVAVNRGQVTGVVFLAKSLLGPRPLSDFDGNTDWIGMRNGVYDTATGRLLPHSPKNWLTHQVPYDYDPEAACPRWLRFMSEVMLTTEGLPHGEWIGLLQEWFGVCMIPDTSAQTAMFWLGGGANGKGTATRLLRRLVGDDFCTDLPIEQIHDPYHRAELFGKLVAFVDEPDPRAMQKNGAYFKRLTGENYIDARRPTEKVFNFKPTCRLIITLNDLLSTSDVSHGFFRRILLIDWRYDAPKEAIDTHLDAALAAELSGIFNWAMTGLVRWKARGRAFLIPKESDLLKAEYRRGEDSIGGFIEEQVVEDPFADDPFAARAVETPVPQVYAAYAEWSKARGIKPASNKALGQRLVKLKYRNELKRVGGRVTRVWVGLALDGPKTLEDEGLADVDV